MGEVKNDNEKCRSCYLVEGCMLTVEMSKRCGGPWKDEVARTDFIQEHILGIKKEKEKKPDIKSNKVNIKQNKLSK